eukprot:gene12719-biopygen12043
MRRDGVRRCRRGHRPSAVRAAVPRAAHPCACARDGRPRDVCGPSRASELDCGTDKESYGKVPKVPQERSWKATAHASEYTSVRC